MSDINIMSDDPLLCNRRIQRLCVSHLSWQSSNSLTLTRALPCAAVILTVIHIHIFGVCAFIDLGEHVDWYLQYDGADLLRLVNS